MMGSILSKLSHTRHQRQPPLDRVIKQNQSRRFNGAGWIDDDIGREHRSLMKERLQLNLTSADCSSSSYFTLSSTVSAEGEKHDMPNLMKDLTRATV